MTIIVKTHQKSLFS